jgi:hypothetical protein
LVGNFSAPTLLGIEGHLGYQIQLIVYCGHLEQFQQLFKFISILSLYLHYPATLYLFFQTNSPTVLSISLSSLLYLNILFYSFISFKYIFFSFFIIISSQQLTEITNGHNQPFLPIAAATTTTTVNQPRATKNHHKRKKKKTKSGTTPPPPGRDPRLQVEIGTTPPPPSRDPLLQAEIGTAPPPPGRDRHGKAWRQALRLRWWIRASRRGQRGGSLLRGLANEQVSVSRRGQWGGSLMGGGGGWPHRWWWFYKSERRESTERRKEKRRRERKNRMKMRGKRKNRRYILGAEIIFLIGYNRDTNVQYCTLCKKI